MSSLPSILCITLLGYLLLTKSVFFRFRSARYSEARLYLESVVYGLIPFGFGILIYGYLIKNFTRWHVRGFSCLRTSIKTLLNTHTSPTPNIKSYREALESSNLNISEKIAGLEKLQQIEKLSGFEGTFSMSFDLALITFISALITLGIIIALNCYYREDINNPKQIEKRKKLLLNALQGREYELMLAQASFDERMLLFTLSNRKVYIGQVIKAPDPKIDLKEVVILPYLSASRHQDTLELNHKIDYRLIITRTLEEPAAKGIAQQFFKNQFGDQQKIKPKMFLDSLKNDQELNNIRRNFSKSLAKHIISLKYIFDPLQYFYRDRFYPNQNNLDVTINEEVKKCLVKLVEAWDIKPDRTEKDPKIKFLSEVLLFLSKDILSFLEEKLKEQFKDIIANNQELSYSKFIEFITLQLVSDDTAELLESTKEDFRVFLPYSEIISTAYYDFDLYNFFPKPSDSQSKPK